MAPRRWVSKPDADKHSVHESMTMCGVFSGRSLLEMAGCKQAKTPRRLQT
jgi:hypothetical protein